MRNNTKLKTLLIKYTVSFDLDDDGAFILLLTDKSNNESREFIAESYSRVLGMAYSYLLKEMKNRG